jgi:hypothetical protein
VVNSRVVSQAGAGATAQPARPGTVAPATR